MTQNAAIYARVSTKDQDCGRQIADLGSWAERRGFNVVLIAQEHASGAKNERKERRRILDAAKYGTIDAILVTELSRWSRSLTDLVHTLEQLASCGVSVKALNGMDMDLTTASGRMLVQLLGTFAEFERNLIRERTISGLEAAKRRGVVLGRRLGDRPTDRFKRAVADLRTEKVSIREIARRMNLSTTTVQRLLRPPPTELVS